MKHSKKILFAAASLMAVCALQAQSLSQAIASVDNDLESALQELAQLREEIAAERIPLSQEVDSLEATVLKLNNDFSRQQSLRDNRELGLQQLQNEVNSKKEEIEYVGGLLRDFVRSFGAQIHVSEKQLYADLVKNAESAALAGNLAEKELFDIQMGVVAKGLDRLSETIGGYTFEGKAINQGEKIPGKFALIGPTVYFRSDNGLAAGVADLEMASGEVTDATIRTADFFNVAAIGSTIDNGSGQLPMDATLGAAFTILQTKDTFFEHVAKGGFVGMMILCLGAVTALIGIFKIATITTFRVPSGSFVLDLAEMVKRGEKEKALEKAKSFGGLAGDMFQEAVANADQPRGLIEEYLSVKIIIARRKLESLLPFVAIIAAAAPLMGLLGTVVGMIKTFQLITVFGTGDARSLSSGISEALVTTELGLFVAIPSLIIHGILNRMARTKWGQLEQDSIVFLNDVKED
ncbi:MAG: MotA/TolQ/ExbB proton channel family protein [Puniceicoccaceae bacterium]